MARHALLIGVSEFADERLARLNAPTNDVMALRGILQDSSRGSFDGVELSLNEDFLAVRDHLSNFFNDRAPDDVLLIYYSGHGILGRGNRLFLATGGSNLDTPFTRSISAQEIRDFIEYSRAQRQIVVLDCCHSGAFAEHAKAAVPPPAVTRATFSSSDAGTYVLTAADTLQFAWDGTELRAGNEAAAGFSQFTSWLVEGLEKGEAAPDDEQITMDALYRYLSRRARSEGSAATPQRFVQGGVGDLVISANPLMALRGLIRGFWRHWRPRNSGRAWAQSPNSPSKWRRCTPLRRTPRVDSWNVICRANATIRCVARLSEP